jgi:TRAP-type mannitol/chloroaromatic compound transport system permease small subunit
MLCLDLYWYIWSLKITQSTNVWPRVISNTFFFLPLIFILLLISIDCIYNYSSSSNLSPKKILAYSWTVMICHPSSTGITLMYIPPWNNVKLSFSLLLKTGQWFPSLVNIVYKCNNWEKSGLNNDLPHFLQNHWT